MEKPLANICIISQQVGKLNRMNDNESRSCSNKLNAGNPGAVWKTATTSIMDHHITSHHMRNLMRDYREKARAAKGQSEIKRQQKLMLHSPIPVPKHSVRRL